MAIAPNVTFVSGAILTAAQQNAFGFGIVAKATSTTSDTSVTSTETVQLTASTFTAIANRYYKITYFEPQPFPSAGTPNYIQTRIRLTNTAGTCFATAIHQVDSNQNPAVSTSLTNVTIQTLTAGSTVIVATALVNGGTGTCTRSATQPALLLVEDIGPA